MTEPHDNQIVRRDDHRPLPARARHVISFFGHRIPAVAVDPKEGAINRALVGFPGRRKRAHELRESFGQYALAVPYAVLKIQIAEARPIAPRRELISLREE